MALCLCSLLMLSLWFAFVYKRSCNISSSNSGPSDNTIQEQTNHYNQYLHHAIHEPLPLLMIAPLLLQKSLHALTALKSYMESQAQIQSINWTTLSALR